MSDLRERVARIIEPEGFMGSFFAPSHRKRGLEKADAILAIVDPAAIRRAALEEAAAHLDALAKRTPLGHEDEQRGASTYNWLRTHAAAIRALKEKEPDDE